MIHLLMLYLFISSLGIASLSVFTFSKGRTRHTRLISLMCFFILIYVLGYLFELNSESIERIMFWNFIQFFGIAFYPPLWLYVALSYGNKTRYFQKRWIAIIFAMPLISFAIRVTLPYHDLLYSQVGLRAIDGLFIIRLERGSYFLVHSLYLFVVLLWTNYIYYKEYKSAPAATKEKFVVLFIASIVPYIGLVMIITDFLKIGLDYAAILLPVSAFILGVSIIKFDLLEVKSLAREQIFENSMDGMILFNHKLKIVDYNLRAKELVDALGLDISMIGLSDLQNINGFPQIDVSSQLDYKLSLKIEDEPRHFDITCQRVQSSHHWSGYLLSVHDITEREILQQQLRELAQKDGLSGLNNRRHFMQMSEILFKQSILEEQPCSLLMLDLDDFKSINDSFGHGAGDLVIQEVGSLLYTCFRKTDVVSRMGGEEFAVFLPHTTLSEAMQKAEFFRKALEECMIKTKDALIHVTVSIGVATATSEINELELLLQKADKSLYLSKNKGKNRITA
jgi:diguanylate cyclase (GGDEF)-like protein